MEKPHRGAVAAAPDPASIRDVYRARAVLEGAGIRRWPVAPEELREQVRTSLVAFTAAVRSDPSSPRLDQGHLAFHVSLVALTGSPRLVRMAEDLVAELQPALARVERTPRGAHDQADSHMHLVHLLERGEHDAATHYLARHLADAEVDLIQALGLS